ncbi:MAG TPA: hemerythrin domain-containing protein [Marmoricola sp.]|jgi:hypothetical protein|nr:hemerythrin domain-containing protein [Marmoricola sp.]
MAAMTMNRAVHEAVRRDLRRTQDALRMLVPGDGAQARGLRRAWEHLRGQLHHHHTAEDELIWPFLRSRGVTGPHVEAMEEEHREMALALDEGATALDGVVLEPTRGCADEAANTVARAGKVICAHLDHEEADVEPLILALSSDPGWLEVQKQLGKVSLSEAGQMIAWISDGAPDEVTAFLRAEIPAPVAFVLGRAFGRRYRREIAPVWRG